MANPQRQWYSRTRLAGWGGIGRSAGAAGAMLHGLVIASERVAVWANKFATWVDPGRATKVMVWPGIPDSEIRLGTVQFSAFMFTLGIVMACVAVVVLTERFVERLSPSVAAVLAGAVLISGLSRTHSITPFAGKLAVVCALVVMLPLANLLRNRKSVPLMRSPRGHASFAMACEGAALAWGIWLVRAREGFDGTLGMALVAAMAVAGALVGAREEDPKRRRITQDMAIACTPLLGLPLLAVLREPSKNWLIAAVTICLAVYVALRGDTKNPRGWPQKIPTLLVSALAPLSVGMIFIIPPRFRELTTINSYSHEGIHLGWINSVTFGKFMMADAGTVYGPLREYTLTAFAAIMGMTAEHVRIAQILVNVIGLGFMLAASFRVVRGRLSLHFIGLVLFVMHSAVSFFLYYREAISFGWADLWRAGWAAVALVGAVQVISLRPKDQRSWKIELRPLFGWGVVMGLAVLYSQDFGLCAFGSVGLALGADALLRADGPLRARAKTILRNAGAFTAGTFAPLMLFVIIYALAGRLHALIHAILWTGLLASGAWSGIQYPVSEQSLITGLALSGGGRDAPVLEFAMPLAACTIGIVVVVASAARGRWTARTTLIFALALFSVTAMRHALLRGEIYHLRSDGTPSLLLWLALMEEAIALVPRALPLRLPAPMGALASMALLIAWAWWGDTMTPLQKKLHLIASGQDQPSYGERYQNDDLPRMGDINVPPEVHALAAYTVKVTSPRDPVFSTIDFIQGGEYNFFTGRRNPTRFDVPHELLVREDQLEVERILREDPPVVIIGTYYGLIGPDAAAYIRAHWEPVNVPGAAFPVYKYKPPLTPQ